MEKSKKPVVIVGMVTNKSHEHIEAETFMNDLERSFIMTDKGSNKKSFIFILTYIPLFLHHYKTFLQCLMNKS